MKKHASAVLGFAFAASIALGSTSVFAQTASMSYRSEQPSYSSSSTGFRIAILKPSLDVGISVNGSRFKLGDAKPSVGFSVGYVNLPIQMLGFTTSLTHFNFEDTDTGIFRLDGNLAYSISSIVNFKGGLNLSSITGFQEPRLSPAIGAQLGVGFQINRNLGIDLAAVTMRQSSSEDGDTVALDQTGVEIGLHATF